MADEPVVTADSLLSDAEDALHSISLRSLGVAHLLKTPYTDRPELSPWTYTLGPQAERAHNLARAIRQHLGLPHRWPTSALGHPPITAAAALADVVTELRTAGITTGAAFEQLLAECDAAAQDTAAGDI